MPQLAAREKPKPAGWGAAAQRRSGAAMRCLQACRPHAPHAPHALRARRGVAPAAARPCARQRCVTAAAAAALPALSPAGAAAKAALLARVATAPDRGVFGLPVCSRHTSSHSRALSPR
jgi:hypothetical protein